MDPKQKLKATDESFYLYNPSDACCHHEPDHRIQQDTKLISNNYHQRNFTSQAVLVLLWLFQAEIKYSLVCLDVEIRIY